MSARRSVFEIFWHETCKNDDSRRGRGDEVASPPLSSSQCALLLPKNVLLFSRITLLFSRNALLFPGVALLFSKSVRLFFRSVFLFLKRASLFSRIDFSRSTFFLFPVRVFFYECFFPAHLTFSLSCS